MDHIEGITLQGSITGTVYGGAILASGKINSAIHLNGMNQEVRFGRYLDKCYHLPEMCETGSTFAYWLKWKPTVVGVIFDSGGFYSASRGYAHWLLRNGKMLISVKDATHYHTLVTPAGYMPQDQWVYVVQTWSPLSSVKLYIDGCLFAESGKRISRKYDVSWDVNLVIGSHSLGSNKRANISLDNMLAWDEELSHEEVWRLFIQKGQVQPNLRRP